MGRGTAPWQVGGWEPRHTVEGGWIRVHRGRGEQWRRPVMPRCGAGARSPRRAGVSREPRGGGDRKVDGMTPVSVQVTVTRSSPLPVLHTRSSLSMHTQPRTLQGTRLRGDRSPAGDGQADAEPGGQETPGSAELRHSQPVGWSSGKVKGRWARDPLGLGHSCACPEGGLSTAALPPQRLPPSSSTGLSAIPLPAQAGRACACHQQCPCA